MKKYGDYAGNKSRGNHNFPQNELSKQKDDATRDWPFD